MNSKEIREAFGDQINLENMKLNPGDIQLIKKIGLNIGELEGKSELFERTIKSFSSDGRFIRHIREIYQFVIINGKLAINYIEEFSDDDGMEGRSENTIEKGRDLLNMVKDLMKKSKDLSDILSD